MIVTEYGTQKVVCDSCDITEHLIEDDFTSEIARMKADGWKITRPEGHWRHECAQCVTETSSLTRTRKMFGIR